MFKGLDKERFALQIVFTIFDYAMLPEEVSRSLALQPEEAMRHGERNPELGLPKQSFWSLRSYASDLDADLSEHWSSIEHLTKKIDTINNLKRSGYVRLTIIADGTGRIPGIVIPAALASFASQLEADIDVDISQQPTLYRRCNIAAVSSDVG